MSGQSDELVIHPAVTKTFFKGLIAIGVFSLFLEVNPRNLGNYFIFLAISLALVFCYMGSKWSARYVVGAGGVTIYALLAGGEKYRLLGDRRAHDFAGNAGEEV